MPPSPVTPIFGSKSFSCPHCGAHSDQTWFSGFAKMCDKDRPPQFVDLVFANEFAENKPSREMEDADYRRLRDYFLRAARGQVFLDNFSSQYVSPVVNIYFSKCYTCEELSLWFRDTILYPDSKYEVEASPDLPPEVRADFEEARSILDKSPRGSAALLRLAVQKLCKFLGKPGENINADIASLVKDGLNIRVQQALDVVRVVGNNAVHPGQMDLKDDRDTAAKLFLLVNRIAYDTITHPRELKALYSDLPEAALAAIEKRDS